MEYDGGNRFVRFSSCVFLFGLGAEMLKRGVGGGEAERGFGLLVHNRHYPRQPDQQGWQVSKVSFKALERAQRQQHFL